MKFIRIILIVLVVVILLAVGGVYFFVSTLDLNRYRAQIQDQVSRAVGTEVTLGELSSSFSLSDGVQITVADVTIPDDTSFSNNPLMTLEKLELDVALMPYLQQREIRIPTIRFLRPEIRIIKNEAGELNIAALRKEPSPVDVPASETNEKPVSPSSRKSIEELPDWKIQSLELRDGVFIYEDQEGEVLRRLPIENISLSLYDIEAREPVAFVLLASLWSRESNLTVTGTLRFDPAELLLRLDDVVFKTNMDQIQMARMREDMQLPAPYTFVEQWQGQVTIRAGQVIMSSEGGMPVISAQITVEEMSVPVKGLPVPVGHLNAALTINDTDLVADRVRLDIGSGALELKGRITDLMATPSINTDLDLDGIPLEELLSGVDTELQMAGLITGAFHLEGDGWPSADMSGWQGSGQIGMDQGIIKNMNILKTALAKLQIVPGLVERLIQDLPEEYQAKLEREHTVIEQVSGQLNLVNGFLVIPQVSVDADGFLVEGSGQYDLDQTLNWKMSLSIPPEVSLPMIQSVPELAVLTNAEQAIVIPFKPYQGSIHKISLMPDVSGIGQQLIRQKGKTELRNVLMDALDLEKETPPAETPASDGTDGDGQPAADSPAPAAAPEEILLDNMLNSLFK